MFAANSTILACACGGRGPLVSRKTPSPPTVSSARGEASTPAYLTSATTPKKVSTLHAHTFTQAPVTALTF